jgi:hypothetical protein
VVIAAERRGDTVEQLIGQIMKATDDQEAALAAIDLTELIHGTYRAQTPEIRQQRESFINELLADLTVYPYTKETALLAGKLSTLGAFLAVELHETIECAVEALASLGSGSGQEPDFPVVQRPAPPGIGPLPGDCTIKSHDEFPGPPEGNPLGPPRFPESYE